VKRVRTLELVPNLSAVSTVCTVCRKPFEPLNLQGDGTLSLGNKSLKMSFHLSALLWAALVLALDRSFAACFGVIPSGGCPGMASQIELRGTVSWESSSSSFSKTFQHLLQYGAAL
jgi:hypothetical protein